MAEPSEFEELSIPDQARQCWREAIEREKDLREDFKERMRYRAGDQWDEKDVNARGKERPHIVVNLLEQPIQQVINQNLLNKPGGSVSPADDDANGQVAEYLEGRIRHIEYASDSQVAYAAAISYVASGGFGLIGLTVDFVGPESLEQEVRIRMIEDPACWALDRSNKEPDGRDRRWAVGRQKFSQEEFKRRWPDAQVVDASFYALDATFSDWGNGTDVWVGEYWRLTYRKRKLQRFSDGSTGFLDDRQFLRRLPAGVTALPGDGNTREVDYPEVTQYLVSGAEVLDETPWIGPRIPIYEVVATQFYSDGKRIVKSLISDALPSQQTYNCSESLKLEAVVLAPKPKWLASVAQIEGHEDRWKMANTSTDAILYYNGAQDSRGNPIPPPDWRVFTPPVQEFTLVSSQAKEDVKATTGFFDPSLGALNSADRSGKAILALQQQTGQGTAHYAENLAFALKALYQDIIEVDLKLNRGSGPKQVRVTGPNGQHKLVRVNDPNVEQARQLMLDKGRYEVVISVGPSWRNQREAAANFVTNTAQADPPGWALIRDIGARLMEPQLGHWAEEVAQRWTPPQFANQDPNQPPQVQQAMAQVSQLAQENQQLKMVIEQKQTEENGKYQRQLQTEQMKYATETLRSETQIRVAEMQAKNDQLLGMMDARVKQLESMSDRFAEMIKLGHAKDLAAHAQAHEAGLEAMKHANAMHQMVNTPQPVNGADQSDQSEPDAT